MAPVERSPSIDPTDEYNNFIDQLQRFHEKRGTLKTFEAQPKVGTPARRVDLLKLYNRVVSDGGYDEVSNTRLHKLYWRNLGQELELGDQNLPGLAFTLKTSYYKNLVAYEILNFHKKEPPPKEILEEVSAKGGDVMSRSIDTFHRPMSRDGVFLNGNHADGEDDEGQGTPGGEEESGIGRRLRQAPAQRQLFQSDMTLTRQTRNSSGQTSSPAPQNSSFAPSTPNMSANYATNGQPPTLATYEPRPPQPLTMRPVTTPANNYEAFKTHQRNIKERALAQMRKLPPKQSGKPIMPPGTGFPGPSIYYRALLSLQSGVLDEQEYALHHLVKISHERGDKYRFDSFQGLAEALIKKVLEAGDLFLGSNWTISYKNDHGKSDPEALDGINTTPGLLKRLRNSKKRKLSELIQDETFARRLNLINEAGLVIRNMVMLEENSQYLARVPAVKDMIVLVLNLPKDPSLIELKQNILELAEQVGKFYATYEDDALFKTLVAIIDSTDRAQITTSLRTLCRLGTDVGQLARLSSVPLNIVQLVCNWVLVEDEDLRGACLDFLFQYTVLPENVRTLLRAADIDGLVKQLVRLLLHNPLVDERESSNKPPPPTPSATPVTSIPIPRIPQDLIDQLLVHDEPERSSQWLRACFEEDPAGEITQIALWQAYQVPFAQYGAQRPLLPAKDFITNVSNTFQAASAQVMNGPGAQQRFVIKGIKARKTPVDPKGKPYMRCQWHVDVEPQPNADSTSATDQNPQTRECGEFALWPKHMWEHVVQKHLMIERSDGRFEFKDEQLAPTHRCRWAGCPRFDKEPASAPTVGMHVKTHLPDSGEGAYRRSKHNSTRNILDVVDGLPDDEIDDDDDDHKDEQWTRTWQTQNTAVDDRSEAAGLPLMSVLVLRNLARNLPGATAKTSNHNHDAQHPNAHSPSASPQRNRRMLLQQEDDPIAQLRAMLTPLDPSAEAALGTKAAVHHQQQQPQHQTQEPVSQDLESNMVWRVFAPVKEQIYFVLAYNAALGSYLTDLLIRIEAVTG